MKRLLVVDDEQQNLYILQVLLSANGFDVELASNGAEALERARRAPPDMIISDILMPVMDGFALCRTWMEDERLKHIPFVFYTATYTDPRDEDFALSLGATRFIVKPVEPDKFLTLLRETITAHEAGKLAAPREPVKEEAQYYKEYNTALIHKLESKMLRLEEVNRALEVGIAERKRTETLLRKLNRTYELLSKINQAIVRIREPQTLFDQICRIAIEVGGFRMAWIGLVDEFSQQLHVVAHAGGAEAYLEQAGLTLQGEPVEYCPIQKALRDGQSIICNTMRPVAPCQQIASQLGARSTAAFPLVVVGKIRGAVNFYSGEADFFDAEEIKLLEEVIMDISFAMEFAEKDAERKQAEEALQQLNTELEDRIQERTAQLETSNRSLQDEIAERQHVEAQLLLLHNAVETTDVGVTITDVAGTILYVNPAEARMHGYAIADLIGQPAQIFAQSELGHQITFEQLQPHWERESLNRRRDGSTFPAHLVSTPVYDAAGEPAGIITISEDITERKHVELELQQAKDAADAANRAKSEFLANMSHELRTPLNAILGYAQILPEADNFTDQQRDILYTIQRSGEHLLQMINDILDLAKIEAGRMELTPGDVHLPDLLQDLGNMIRIRARQQGITFVLDVASGLPEGIRTDEKRLREVLLNLLSNAVKFTSQGSVTLRVLKLETGNSTLESHQGKLSVSNNQCPVSNIQFQVEDTGIGIPPDDLDKIFSPFHRVGKTSRSIEGTGLGLTISRKIVEFMGGTLRAASTPGQGSIFWFEIPLIEVASLPQPGQIAQPHVTGYAEPRRAILVVDDQPVNRKLLLTMLLPLGFHVTEAQNAEDCLTKVGKAQPDLILLDLRMPDTDGFTVARHLRQMEALNHTRIIACSASVFAEIRQQSLDAGCDDFLAKPIQREELLAILQKHLQVEWIYADQPHQVTGNALAPCLLRDMLHQLPLEYQQSLLCAATRGNVKTIMEQLDAVAQLGDQFLPLVQEIRACAKRFQVDRIVELIEGLEK